MALRTARATVAAFRDGRGWLEEVCAYVRGNAGLVADALAEVPGARLTVPEGTYLAWVDVSAYGTNNEDRYRRCEQALVLPTNGTFFGKAAGEGFMRLNFGCPRSQLTQGPERFAKALNGYGKG